MFSLLCSVLFCSAQPVIKKALVDLEGKPFLCLQEQRADWSKYDLYRSPGPIQFHTDVVPNTCDGVSTAETRAPTVELSITLTLELQGSDPRMCVQDLEAAKRVQDEAPHYGKFIFEPLVGTSNAVFSSCQRARANYRTPLCPALADRATAMSRVVLTAPTQCSNAWDRETLSASFPFTYGAPLASIEPPVRATPCPSPGKRPLLSAKLRTGERGSRDPHRPLVVGIVFCGRQSPGGHDIIAGVLDAIAELPEGSKLWGFVGGSKGLLSGHAVEVTADLMANYRGQGGYDLLGRTMERIEHSAAVYEKVAASCNALGLDGLVMMGGPRSNTDAAYLAEHFKATGMSRTCVVTVPLTMNGGIRNQFVETTVGFDTASKVASQIVGNNATDGASAKKYYYFQRLMGMEPSHLTLEVALRTKPNFTLLAEEVKQNNTKLADVVNSIADMVEDRARQGKNYGSVILPEGLIESIPELGMLISELDAAYSAHAHADASAGASAGASGDAQGASRGPHSRASNPQRDIDRLRGDLTLWSRALLDSLPTYIQAQLMLSRTSDNRMLLSQAETERLLAHFVGIELDRRKKRGSYVGSFSVICSFIGYQARGATPSNFDVTYAYNLGTAAVALVGNELSGYMATINNLKGEVSCWQASGVPITAMIVSAADSSNPGSVTTSNNSSTGGTFTGGACKSVARRGSGSPQQAASLCVPTALLDLSSAAYRAYLDMKPRCMHSDLYENPGPTQFFGPTADSKPCSLVLER